MFHPVKDTWEIKKKGQRPSIYLLTIQSIFLAHAQVLGALRFNLHYLFAPLLAKFVALPSLPIGWSACAATSARWDLIAWREDSLY